MLTAEHMIVLVIVLLNISLLFIRHAKPKDNNSISG